jgi:hypothetical protein
MRPRVYLRPMRACLPDRTTEKTIFYRGELHREFALPSGGHLFGLPVNLTGHAAPGLRLCNIDIMEKVIMIMSQTL